MSFLLKKTVHKILIFVILFVVSAVPTITSVQALTISELQQKSRDLQASIDANNARIKELGHKEETLKGKIAELNTEISIASEKIELTKVKIDELSKRLKETEAELERQRGLLAASLRALYERRDASTVELLVASDSFSDFINGQEYLQRLQSAIKESTDKMISLKKQIEEEKAEQQALKQKQEQQRSVLSAKRQEQQTILNETNGEESRYRSMVSAQQDALEEAEKELTKLLSSGSQMNLGPVSRGQVIGSLGSTGYSTGPHLHFMVKRNGESQNPYAGGGTLINGYQWPLPNSNSTGYISQLYGCVAPAWYYSTSCNNGQNSFHSGLDIYGNAYDPIVAAESGTIIFRGCSSGLGFVVAIDHGNGWQTWYPHQVTPSGQVYGYC